MTSPTFYESRKELWGLMDAFREAQQAGDLQAQADLGEQAITLAARLVVLINTNSPEVTH